jgi:hypothetical protein
MSANEEEVPRGFDILELLAAVLLGLAAITTAFASFESALYGGKSVENYGKANKVATEAAAERSRAIVEMSRDNTIDSEAMRLILEGDDAASPAAEQRNYAVATYLYTRQMSDPGYKALGLPPEARKPDDAAGDEEDEEAVEEKQTALQENLLEKAMEKDLSEDENYRKEMLSKSQTLFDEAEKVFKEGQEANEIGDKFQLAAVVYSISLFFGGILQVFRNRGARAAILGAGGLFFVAATVYVLTLPIIGG